MAHPKMSRALRERPSASAAAREAAMGVRESKRLKIEREVAKPHTPHQLLRGGSGTRTGNGPARSGKEAADAGDRHGERVPHKLAERVAVCVNHLHQTRHLRKMAVSTEHCAQLRIQRQLHGVRGARPRRHPPPPECFFRLDATCSTLSHSTCHCQCQCQCQCQYWEWLALALAAVKFLCCVFFNFFENLKKNR